MKLSEAWLREWSNPILTREELCTKLTMGGFEIEELAPVAEIFSGIIIGEVTKAEKQVGSEQLSLCDVNIGRKMPLKIVCGASNLKIGMKVPVAMINAVLPNKAVIKLTTIRGIQSEGMLCSASEIGLSEEHQGIFELPSDAPVGEDIWSYLELEDYVLDVSITPNRGDCLSMRGFAREVSAITGAPYVDLEIPIVKPAIKDTLTVKVKDGVACPHYVGRVIREVRVDAQTPIWMRERLRRGGIRSINSIVDITNYVMLELGQPMHAFDLHQLQRGIIVRQSERNEQIVLLDGSEQKLDNKTLVIADHEKPIAIAGVMGGLNSSVTLLTKDIFLESAYFSSIVVSRQRQHYSLNSESAYRFERGVDPAIQQLAIERATQLILEIAGGNPGPITEEINKKHLPPAIMVELAKAKVDQVLGVAIPASEIERLFIALHFKFQKINFEKGIGWEVYIPSFRFDITLPEDLIEEIARLYGYDKIPTHRIVTQLQVNRKDETALDFYLRQILRDQGFHEIVSYSFVNKDLQNLLDPQEQARELKNPISNEMAVMRTNLWPGLLSALLYNKSRQQHRIRFFEIGTCFLTHANELLQEPKLGGLISGLAVPEQWGMPSREADFYDLKGYVEGLLVLFGKQGEFDFKSYSHPALHPGQSAVILHKEKKIGLIGALHPQILQTIGLSNNVYVFELDLKLIKIARIGHFEEISKFPEIRRDIAIIVNQAIPAKEIQDTIKMVAGDWLKYIFIFDVYQGKGISPGLKSIALALILQHPTRTLVDDEVAELMERVTRTLQGQLGAELRS